MKTLADFKRRIHVGQLWSAFLHTKNKDMGTRPIKRIQSNAVVFDMGPMHGGSYLWYPKAKDVKFPDDNTMEVYDDGVLVLTYKLVADGGDTVSR